MGTKKFKGELKCHRCYNCDGYGCPGNLPGLGGVFENKNFQLNCEGWENLRKKLSSQNKLDELLSVAVSPCQLRCGPVTGAMENIGFENEQDFYYPYLMGAQISGIGLCIGDGTPDEKLEFGVSAIAKISAEYPDKNAAFFLKPYPDEKLAVRVEKVKPYAHYIGIDIDSYNILTMRNLVNLEKKTAQQLQEFRKLFDVPFVIKGVFTQEDLELVRQVKPDVVYISNHGGRVETRIGSTAEFLEQNSKELKKYCQEIWVDGGIRNREDVQTALYFGADKVIMARPLIRTVFDEGAEGLKSFIEELIKIS